MTLDLSYSGLVRLAATVIAVAMALYHMWAIAFGAPEAILFRGTHLLFALVLVFLLYHWDGKTRERPPTLLDYALLTLAAAPIVHLFVNYNYIVTRIYCSVSKLKELILRLTVVSLRREVPCV